MAVAKNIRTLRKRNKLTQKQLALKAGVSQPIIARLENQKSQKTPSVETVAKITSVFGREVNISFPKERSFAG